MPHIVNFSKIIKERNTEELRLVQSLGWTFLSEERSSAPYAEKLASSNWGEGLKILLEKEPEILKNERLLNIFWEVSVSQLSYEIIEILVENGWDPKKAVTSVLNDLERTPVQMVMVAIDDSFNATPPAKDVIRTVVALEKGGDTRRQVFPGKRKCEVRDLTLAEHSLMSISAWRSREDIFEEFCPKFDYSTINSEEDYQKAFEELNEFNPRWIDTGWIIKEGAAKGKEDHIYMWKVFLKNLGPLWLRKTKDLMVDELTLDCINEWPQEKTEELVKHWNTEIEGITPWSVVFNFEDLKNYSLIKSWFEKFGY